MLRAAITFFIIGLLAVFLGANNVGGLSIELGKTLLMVFLVLAVISFLFSLFSGKGGKPLGHLAIFATLFGGLGGLAVTATGHPALADDTVKDKVANKKDDVERDTKKAVRKHKRLRRKAQGTDTVLRDAQDTANDAGDDFSDTAQKGKRKLSH